MATTPPQQPKKWATLTEYKDNKRRKPNDGRTSGVRIITFGQWNDPSIPGPFMYVDINGTVFPCTRGCPFLPEHDLQLTSFDTTKYYDLSWIELRKKHGCRTWTECHADLITDHLQLRCNDLRFEVDKTNARWRKAEGLIIWNNALGKLAFVGLQPLQGHIAKIFPGEGISFVSHQQLYWADNQACIVLEGCDNQRIEAAADNLTELASKFGVDVVLTMTDVCNNHTPPSPSDDPHVS